MKLAININILIIFLLSFSIKVYGDPTAEKLLTKVDELYRSQGSEGKMEMEIITPDWSRVIKMEIWTRGSDYTFVSIQEPKKDHGIGSLKRGNEMWNFFPKINKVIKIPPSMMMGAWMGSDFTNDDLVKNSSLVKDYHSQIEKSDKEEIIISLKPKENTISLWGKINITLNKKSELPEKEEYYDEKGNLVRALNFKEIKKFGNKTIPSVIELEPLTKKGHKTIIRYLDIQFDKDIPETMFSLINLQKRR